MLKFISFGSGSCGNCYYLYTEAYGILIDIGIGVRKLKKYFSDYGLSIQKVRYVLVSHDHADHVKSVGSLSGSLGLPVYATETVHKGIRNNYCVRKKVDPENVRIINKGEEFRLDDFSITTFTVPHDSLDNIGFRIKYGDTTFCLMTDIGHVTPDIEDAISQANYLVIEANHDEDMLRNGHYSDYLKDRVSGANGHLSNRKCAEALLKNATGKLKHVWLCHLSEENNHPELALKTVEMELHKSQTVDAAKIKVDVLKRSMPTGVYELD